MSKTGIKICKQLYALTDLGPEDKVDLNAMREAMGVMQHHDAITGTEKQVVAEDYARMLHLGIVECDIITNTAFNKLFTNNHLDDTNPAPQVNLDSCMLLNISQCEVSEKSSNFVVTVYNPLSHPVSLYVRVPVTGQTYSVKDPNSKCC
uniref:Glycoside hydrolase family 38 central domain-containing protein n=1 Tax=Timema cristinae TaxID=61476 RepID=A0A7R9CMN6_TIMCR|nr:unnamed protein product [Timema cristinae]